MKPENFKPTPNNFRMPLPGENIAMVCKNCGWHGSTPKPDDGVLGAIFGKGTTKCPQCGKKTLEEDPFVLY